MRSRVFGIETEYAVIYHPGRGEVGRPTNLALYELFEPRMRQRVRSLPRGVSLLRAKRGCYLENGASFHYEATPQDFEHGLIEMASPECRDPFALLAHERAKDALVEELARDVTEHLRRLGRSGEVRIGKNNVDSEGHTFGSHESYWVDDSLDTGSKLLLLPVWLGLWVLSLPAFLWLFVAFLGVLLAGAAVLLAPLLGALARGAASLMERIAPGSGGRLVRFGWRLRAAPPRLFRWVDANPGEVARKLQFLELPMRPVVAAHSLVYRHFHFRRCHERLTAFLVTRTLFCGAGAVRFDGGSPVRLAQRPPFLRRLSRVFTHGDDRPLYESRDLFFRPWSAFSARRRLHLLLADANLCDWALVLRTGVTALVLEAIEEPDADAWPALRDPLAALTALNRDPAMEVALALADGEAASALEIQRRYLARVRTVFARRPEPPIDWKARVLAMWEETLDLLEHDPDALEDRIDWIAKRGLLRREVADDVLATLRERGAEVLEAAPGDPTGSEDRTLRDAAYRALRVDLRYHELGPRGGHRRLLRQGRVRSLVGDDEVARARSEPPGDTRAYGRGRAIREACEGDLGGGATWHRVRVGPTGWRFFLDPLSPAAWPRQEASREEATGRAGDRSAR